MKLQFVYHTGFLLLSFTAKNVLPYEIKIKSHIAVVIAILSNAICNTALTIVSSLTIVNLDAIS